MLKSIINPSSKRTHLDVNIFDIKNKDKKKGKKKKKSSSCHVMSLNSYSKLEP